LEFSKKARSNLGENCCLKGKFGQPKGEGEPPIFKRLSVITSRINWVTILPFYGKLRIEHSPIVQSIFQRFPDKKIEDLLLQKGLWLSR